MQNNPLTTQQAADSLGIKVKTLRKQLQRGKIAATKFGNALAFDPDEVERYRRENLGRTGNPTWRSCGE